MSIGVLQLLLAVLQLLGPLLLPLELPNVVDGRLQDGAFVPAHVPGKRTERPLHSLSLVSQGMLAQKKNELLGCCEISLPGVRSVREKN